LIGRSRYALEDPRGVLAAPDLHEGHLELLLQGLEVTLRLALADVHPLGQIASGQAVRNRLKED
jgi:hypothetical protein